jgi:hypothetical protein
VCAVGCILPIKMHTACGMLCLPSSCPLHHCHTRPAAAPSAAAAATREASIALIDALSSNDEAAALALLQQSPASSRLAWVRDSRSGGYPAHVAAWHGLGQFIRQLVEMHGGPCYLFVCFSVLPGEAKSTGWSHTYQANPTAGRLRGSWDGTQHM